MLKVKAIRPDSTEPYYELLLNPVHVELIELQPQYHRLRVQLTSGNWFYMEEGNVDAAKRLELAVDNARRR